MITVYQGHVLDILRNLLSRAVHTVITSPPYWGLRNYDLPLIEWPPVTFRPMAGLAEVNVPGCAPGCVHEWGEMITQREQSGQHRLEWTMGGNPAAKVKQAAAPQGQFCRRCFGWRGSLGWEVSPLQYVAHIVLIWRELWRVLRGDGTCWLNLGSSYAGSWGNSGHRTQIDGGESVQRERTSEYWQRPGYDEHRDTPASANPRAYGFKQKDLIPIPWMVALALQAEGWYLRSDIIYAKGLSFATHQTKCPSCGRKHEAQYSGSCMPESVTDRPTKSHEYVFLLSKSPKYYWDIEAVRESGQPESAKRYKQPFFNSGKHRSGNYSANGAMHTGGEKEYTGKRNIRTVWTINPASFPGSHFATFPPALISPMIRAATSERGCCPKCKAPWRRMMKQIRESSWKRRKADGHVSGNATSAKAQQKQGSLTDDADRAEGGFGVSSKNITTGWQPICQCNAGAPIPATILDPFWGAGTTSLVAERLGRDSVGIELNEQYIQMGANRIFEDAPLFTKIEVIK